MSLLEGLWYASTLLFSGSVIGMLYIYRSLEKSFNLQLEFMEAINHKLMELYLIELRKEHDDGVQSKHVA